MATWILIWFITGGIHEYGITSGSQEFAGQDACLDASIKMQRLSKDVRTICVAKGGSK